MATNHIKILLVSDSHGNNNALYNIANKHLDCDYYLHLGDSESTPEDIRPFVSVRGNCDYFTNSFKPNLVLKTPIGKMYLEHIPFNQMKIHSLKREGYKFYLCGHTHIKKDEIIEGVRVINPGSITYPRRGNPSYAIIEINDCDVRVNFIDV